MIQCRISPMVLTVLSEFERRRQSTPENAGRNRAAIVSGGQNLEDISRDAFALEGHQQSCCRI